MSDLIIIPARSGSTRVRDKNIREICGKPLIAYSIESAIDSGCGRVVVSTDSERYADIARSYGAETPFLRPRELAGPRVTTSLVLRQAVEWFRDNENWTPGFVILCPPTNPFRSAETIRAMVDKLRQRPDVNSIVTIMKAMTHPFKIIKRSEDGRCQNGVMSLDGKNVNDVNQSQYWPEAWEGNAACRITRSACFLKREDSIPKSYDIDNFIGYEIGRREGFDIDSEEDLELAEFYIKKGTLSAISVTRKISP